MKTRNALRVMMVASMAALLLGAGLPGLAGEEEEEPEFDEVEIFFEFNSTDNDLGIHIFFDGPAWKKVTVKGPQGKVYSVKNAGMLRQLGSTELFTESAEPPLDVANLQQEIDDFLAMFPEGEYEFLGKTTDGQTIEDDAELTHDLPAAPIVDVSSFPDVSWTPGADGPAIVEWEYVTEIEVDDGFGEELLYVENVILPAGVTSTTASDELVATADAAELAGTLIVKKVEVIGREASGNKTSVEIVLFEAD